MSEVKKLGMRVIVENVRKCVVIIVKSYRENR